jgi:hypothetical protein
MLICRWTELIIGHVLVALYAASSTKATSTGSRPEVVNHPGAVSSPKGKWQASPRQVRRFGLCQF